MLETIDRAIAAVAAGQQGVITARQLLDLGLSRGGIEHRVRTGRLYRLYRGVYAVGHRPVSPLAHAMAAVLACGPDAVLSHGSAATLWGITKEWRSPLEVTTPCGRQRARLCVHRSRTLAEADVTDHFGIRVTSPARTVMDNAPRLNDVRLARAVNELRLGRYLSLADLSELLERHPPCRAGTRLRAHVADPERLPTRSEFEDAFILFAERRGLPPLVVNSLVAGHEVDIFFPGHGLVIELDGYAYHDRRADFERDRDRDADLLAAGIATVRLTWERFTLAPDRESARLHVILERRAPGAR
ncbi:MAG TPA: type IV toxin-antitoxin system AbiEi family antitoxin domain-containing protein [Solirubrobacteraceae bacterium]|nr:type IV toxin-antitoxin system AbiEi family antitoxin domain-containing protein [Solirubrobacteraceae bacterium]